MEIAFTSTIFVRENCSNRIDKTEYCMSIYGYHKRDAIEGCKELPDACIDVILTDPPYFMPANHYFSERKLKKSFADMGIFEYYFNHLFQECHRILKEQGALYMFCNSESYPIFYWHAFQFFSKVRCLLWDKINPKLGWVWRCQHEMILYTYKSQIKMTTSDGDVFQCKMVKVNDRLPPRPKNQYHY